MGGGTKNNGAPFQGTIDSNNLDFQTSHISNRMQEQLIQTPSRGTNQGGNVGYSNV